MDYGPIYTIAAICGLLFVFITVVFRVSLLYKRKERMYRELMSLQDGILFLLDSNSYKCMKVYSSKNYGEYNKLLQKGVVFPDLIPQEFHTLLFSAFENAKTSGQAQEIIVRLLNTPTEEDADFAKLSFRNVLWGSGTMVLVCVMKSQKELMRLQNIEEEIKRQEKHLKNTSFDLLWRIDIETRQLTLLNDLSQERHWVESRPAGVYDLHDFVKGEDYQILEDEINFRVSEFIKNGEDIYAKDSRIIQIRLKSLSSNGVWYGVCGVIDKDDYGRLVMYGAAHRMAIPAVSKVNDFEMKHLFSVLMKSPALRVFWCNLDGVILGCNKGFAFDVGEHSPENLKNRKIDQLEFLKKEWLSYFYKHLENFKQYSEEKTISKYFHVKRMLDNLEVLGQFNVLPLFSESGKAYGGLFVYWVQPISDVNRDILKF